jgi:hypothetical protein
MTMLPAATPPRVLWTARRNGRGATVGCRRTVTAGYGTLAVDGRTVYAHRLLYERHVGPIPAGLSPDHLCQNPACCNPDHLEPVTHAENLRRTRTRRSACRNGHPRTPDNIYIAPDGEWQCRDCNRARKRTRLQQEAAAARARLATKERRSSPHIRTDAWGVQVPPGKCQCGCGDDTPIARKTVTAKGIVKGQPLRYLRGHSGGPHNLASAYRIHPDTGCWIWQRSASYNGYGQLFHEGRVQRAHRVFDALYRGPIPAGLHIDHTCGRTLCVNPAHLEPVTPLENVHRTRRRRAAE